MKNTTIAYLVLAVMVFSLSSCTSDSGSSGSKNTNWRTGSEGITMSFVADNPPSEVVSTQEMNVIVKFANRGASDVNNLRFYLSGYDKALLFVGYDAMTSSNIALEGKNQFNPTGSQEGFETWKTKVNSPRDIDSFKQDFTVTACYSYKTIATPNICIDPMKYDLTSSGKCKFDISDLGSSQGGPIAVTSIKQKTTDSKVYLEIYFANKGTGTPFSGKPVENCYNSLSINDIDTIESISVSMPGGGSFDCNPKGKLRLTSGSGYVVCQAGISGSSYYVSPLNIVLDYNYRQTMTKEITIVNVNPR
jgi:hypothetical protein